MAKVDYKIKWKQTDYMQLGKAIKQFNRTVLSLETDENQAFLPEMQNYQEMKENIKTRKELNRYIKSLRRFNNESSQRIVELDSGEKITIWEQREIEKLSKRALKRINESEGLFGETDKDQFGMGTIIKNTHEQQKQNIINWKTKTGASFRRNIEGIKTLGRLDAEYRKAEIYRKNYEDVMGKYSHYDNFDKFKKFMNSHKNPISFWNAVKDNEILKDLTYQSEQVYTQQEFNEFLINELGISPEELKNFDSESYNKSLLNEAGIEE